MLERRLVPGSLARGDRAAAGALSAQRRRRALLLLVALLVAAPAAAEVLYDNGPIVTSTGSGHEGADESVVQDESLGNRTYGFGHDGASMNRVADDFAVPSGEIWRLDEVQFYAYQPGSTTTSTFDSTNLRIWNGPPGETGSQVVFGDTTTNRLVGTHFTHVYRRAESTGPGDTSRPVMRNTVDTGGVLLEAGIYWLDWQAEGSLDNGSWAVPVTVESLKTTGNGLQSVLGGGFFPALSEGQQGFAFTLFGEK